MRYVDELLEPRPEPEEHDEHECDEDGSPDIDLCTECREHAGFCSECGASSCCGSGAYET